MHLVGEVGGADDVEAGHAEVQQRVARVRAAHVRRRQRAHHAPHLERTIQLALFGTFKKDAPLSYATIFGGLPIGDCEPF